MGPGVRWKSYAWGAEMKLKLAKWCSIIPLFAYALPAAAVLIVMVIDSLEIHDGPLLDTIIGDLFPFVAWVSLLLSVFAVPIPAVLGIVLSAILIFQKERKAIKFLVLSCVDIIISALLALIAHNL